MYLLYSPTSTKKDVSDFWHMNT